jgi:effector-binding domain-containing protein
MIDTSILYKKLEPTQIVSFKTVVESRAEIPQLFERLRLACGDLINGDAMVIFHGGAVKDGFLIEAAFPLESTKQVSTSLCKGGIHTRTLEPAAALTMIHFGAHQTIRESVLEVYDYLGKHAWTASLFRREIYRVLDLDAPEKNVTEIQVILHEWDRLLAEGVDEVFGTNARQKIMQGIESITPSSSFEDYLSWIQSAIHRLDALTDDEDNKCRAVSRCAHVFPQERIDHLRGIYERGEVDDVLKKMYTDKFWYEKPVRRGNVLYMRKNPYNPEGYANAATPAERRKAYCHCPFVHPYLDETPSRLSPTFCYCGAGWYRRLWEGILGQLVKIEHVETLLKGNDQCTLAITLPLEISGECSPDKPQHD